MRPELGADVEGGERLAGGDVAAGVGGADHLHGPLGDRGLGGGEAGGEPALGRGTGDGVEAVGADDHARAAGTRRPCRSGARRRPARARRAAPGGAGPARCRRRRRARSPRSRSAGRRVLRGWPAAASARSPTDPAGYAGAPPWPGRSNRKTRHCLISSGIWRSHMCQVVPSEGPRIRTGASSGPSKRYCRVFGGVSLTRQTLSSVTRCHIAGVCLAGLASLRSCRPEPRYTSLRHVLVAVSAVGPPGACHLQSLQATHSSLITASRRFRKEHRVWWHERGSA